MEKEALCLKSEQNYGKMQLGRTLGSHSSAKLFMSKTEPIKYRLLELKVSVCLIGALELLSKTSLLTVVLHR